MANTVTLSSPTGTVAYTPAQIRAAYGISALAIDGTGQTIAIVDAYDDPSIDQALDAFDSKFGLTASGPTLYQQYGRAASFLTVLNQSGQPTSLPSTDPHGPGTDNWEVEEALDVEWAHAIAPGAQIILVEANSESLSDLMAGVTTAAHQPGVSVVSMSWGFPEGQAVFAADEAAYDKDFEVPGVTFVASTGDYAAADPEYPAFSPNVVAVGGTSLTLNANGSYNSETAWGSDANSPGTSIGSGGGISLYEPEPAYQTGVQSTGGRTTPDVLMVADPATGAWIADTYNLDSSSPFEVAGGTSLAAPAFAGLVALVNQGRAAAGEANLNGSTPTDAQQALYSLPETAFHKIANGSTESSTAAGYNLATGLGSPVADLLVPELIAYHEPSTVSGLPAVAALQNPTVARGTSTNAFDVFGALTATGSGSSGGLSLDTSIDTSLINLTPTVAVTTTSAPHSGLRSHCRSAPSRFTGPPSRWARSRIPRRRCDVHRSCRRGKPVVLDRTRFAITRMVYTTAGGKRTERKSTRPSSQKDRRNLYADALLPGRPRRDLLAESVLDDVAANLLLSRGQDGAATASVPALPPTGARVARDATGPGSQQDQDVPSDTAAAGLVVFGMTAGLWARRSSILNTRKRQSGSRPR